LNDLPLGFTIVRCKGNEAVALNADVENYDIVEIISGSSWFSDLPVECVARLAEAARVRSYRKSSYLYTNGEIGTDIFCILAGRIRLMLTSAIGQEYAITDYEPQTWLGAEFLSGTNNPARLDAQIIESATVLTIPRAVVLEVAEHFPQIFKSLFTDYMMRLSGTIYLLQGMAFYPLRSRLAGWLLELIDKHGQKEDEGVYLDVQLSQNDLAQLSLGSRQRINKILSQWRERGIIELKSNHYLIRDIDALIKETELQDHDD
jgi:CRP-like cAMP-binding protein